MLVKDRAEEAGVSSGAFRLYHRSEPYEGEEGSRRDYSRKVLEKV